MFRQSQMLRCIDADDLIPKVHFADSNPAAILFNQKGDIRKVVFTLIIVICEPKQSTKKGRGIKYIYAAVDFLNRELLRSTVSFLDDLNKTIICVPQYLSAVEREGTEA